MKNETTSGLPVLPCGVPFDALKGECCASNCREPAVRAQRDPKLRFRAVEACRYWTTGQIKATSTSHQTTSKSRKK